jgi:hypothetical protein
MSNVEENLMENKADDIKIIARSYECAGCGEYFDSFDRLRQHEVDCRDDNVDDESL